MKKNSTRLIAIFFVALCLSIASPATAEEENWESLKRESKRMKIDEMAQQALNTLFATNPRSEDLFEMSYGWAVFDNLKLAFVVSGGGGNGVAKVRVSGEKTYMKMGTGGIGIGRGANKYQVIFFVQDRTTFENFVEKGWQADAGATAAAGRNAAEAKTNFVNGLAIYQMTEAGLMAHADIAGTKYWKNKKLNR